MLSFTSTKVGAQITKKAGKTLASQLPTRLTRTVTRKLPLPGLLKKGADSLDGAVSRSLPIKPDTYFDAVKGTGEAFKYWEGMAKATTGGLNLRADLSRHQDPRELDSLGDVLPDAAGRVVGGAGRLAGAAKTGGAMGDVVGAVVEVGENHETWAEEINR
jgi:hypothetical protein